MVLHGKMIILHDADEFIGLALCVTACVVCQDFFKLQPFEGIWGEGRLSPGDDVHELFVAALVSGHVVLPLTEQVVTANEGCDFGNRVGHELKVAVEDAAVDAVPNGCGLSLVAEGHIEEARLEDTTLEREVLRECQAQETQGRVL